MVDLGSSDVWVGSTACFTGCPTSIALYDSTKSSTALNLSTSTTTINYGSGSAAGYIFTDNISMGMFSVSGASFRGSFFSFLNRKY